MLPTSHLGIDLIKPTEKAENKLGKKMSIVKGLGYVQ